MTIARALSALLLLAPSASADCTSDAAAAPPAATDALRAASALSGPLIESVALDPPTIVGGGAVILTLVVRSTLPLRDFDAGLAGPRGPVTGAALAARAETPDPTLWVIRKTFKLSAWAPDGEYRPIGIFVQDHALRDAPEPAGALPILNVSGGRPADAPRITSVVSTPVSARGGEALLLKFLVHSEAPVHGLEYHLVGPDGTEVTGGRSSGYLAPAGEGVWASERPFFVSEWLPPGRYRVERVSVGNAAGLRSEVVTGPEIEIATVRRASTPAVTVVKFTPSEVVPEGSLVVATIEVASDAPPTWLEYIYSGPAGEISRVSLGTQFLPAGPGRWRFDERFIVRDAFPGGAYSLLGLRVRNNGLLWSPPLPGPPPSFRKSAPGR